MKQVILPMGGPQHTEETLRIAKDAAIELGIGHVVVASTQGETAQAAARIFKNTGIRVIVVTHNTGFKEPGIQEMSPEVRQSIEEEGLTVYTGTMVLRSLGAAIRDQLGYSQQELVANTLRILGQGMKVCAEMAAMVADAGLVPIQDIIAVAGSRQGADTAVVIYPQPSNRFFQMKVREILVKPADW